MEVQRSDTHGKLLLFDFINTPENDSYFTVNEVRLVWRQNDTTDGAGLSFAVW